MLHLWNVKINFFRIKAWKLQINFLSLCPTKSILSSIWRVKDIMES